MPGPTSGRASADSLFSTSGSMSADNSLPLPAPYRHVSLMFAPPPILSRKQRAQKLRREIQEKVTEVSTSNSHKDPDDDHDAAHIEFTDCIGVKDYRCWNEWSKDYEEKEQLQDKKIKAETQERLNTADTHQKQREREEVISLSLSSPSRLSPLAAAVLEMAKQYQLPSDISVLVKDEQTKQQLLNTSTPSASESTLLVVPVRNNKRASLMVAEIQPDTERKEAEAQDMPQSSRRQTQSPQGRTAKTTPTNKTFITSVDSITEQHNDNNRTTPTEPQKEWSECTDVNEAIAHLPPSLLHTTPPFPSSLPIHQLLSLTTSSCSLPPILLPVLSNADQELVRYVEWEKARKRWQEEQNKHSAKQQDYRRNTMTITSTHSTTTTGKFTYDTRYNKSKPFTMQQQPQQQNNNNNNKDKVATTSSIRYSYYGEEEDFEAAEKRRQDVLSKAALMHALVEDAQKTDSRTISTSLTMPTFTPTQPRLVGPAGMKNLTEVFHSHPYSDVLNALFLRMSHTYLCLFASVSSKYKDLLFSCYYDIVGECLYHSYVHCFSGSVKLIDTVLFRQRLIEYCSSMMLGYVPAFATCEHWRIGGTKKNQTTRNHRMEMETYRGITSRRSQLPPLTHAASYIQNGQTYRFTAASTRSRYTETDSMRYTGEKQGTMPVLLYRRVMTLDHCPLVQSFLSHHALTPVNNHLSVSLPMSFPLNLQTQSLSKELVDRLRLSVPAVDPSVQQAKREYIEMKAHLDRDDSHDQALIEEQYRITHNAYLTALQSRASFAKQLVKASQEAKYKQLKMQSKHLALKRLTKMKGNPQQDEQKQEEQQEEEEAEEAVESAAEE